MAFTYAGQYTEAILATGSSGATLLPSLPAHLYTVGTTTHVTLYTSRTKGTTTANPVTSDVNGNVTFYADPGQYDVVFTPTGGSLKRITVTVPVDPAEASGTYKPRGPNTVAYVGDSITNNGGGVVGNPSYTSLGFWCWGNSFLNHVPQVAGNYAVAGTTTAALAGQITSALATGPAYVHVLSGTNNFSGSVTVAQTIADLDAALAQIVAGGAVPILGTIPPRGTGQSAGQRTFNEQVNAWIRSQGRVRRPQVIVVDYHSVLTDPSNGQYVPGYTNDQTHPSSRGAATMGKLYSQILASTFVGSPFLPFGDGGAANLLPNGCFTSGGTAGVPPSGWSDHVTVPGGAFSKAAISSDGSGIAGSWQVVTMVNGDPAGWLQANILVDGVALSVGDTVFATVQYDLSSLDPAAAANTQAFFIELQNYNGTTQTSLVTDLSINTDNQPAWNRAGVLQTPPVVVPVGCQQLLCLIWFDGGGVYKINRAGVFNVTKLAAANVPIVG